MQKHSVGKDLVPVVLFAYKRVDLLARVLGALKQDEIPLLIIFVDGARDDSDSDQVAEVRALARSVDWCETRVVVRGTNLGLGRSILQGMREVFHKFDRAIVFEDDIVCVPGTYQYLCDALEFYQDQTGVMSIGAYTPPRLRPASVGANPYFDGRFLCWGWAAWARAVQLAGIHASLPGLTGRGGTVVRAPATIAGSQSSSSDDCARAFSMRRRTPSGSATPSSAISSARSCVLATA